jgi:hypothetical protein
MSKSLAIGAVSIIQGRLASGKALQSKKPASFDAGALIAS